MALSSFLMVIFLVVSPYLKAESKLPILATKQAVSNIRFIAQDGKFTYYQKQSGSLFLSTNYKVIEVLKEEPYAQFQIYGSSDRKRLIITVNNIHQTYYSPRYYQDIYHVPFGRHEADRIGAGVSPQLHLKDHWVSFFQPFDKNIVVKSLVDDTIQFRIKTANSKSPYFVPDVVMINKNEVIYTDINKKGIPGILHYDHSTKKTKVILKSDSHLVKYELCQKEDQIIVGRFGLDSLEKSSIIRSLSLSDLEYSNSKLIYQSKSNDTGNIVCSPKGPNIYFIKKVTSTSKTTFEVARVNMETKTEKIVSDVVFATQIIDMDGSLLIPFQGQFRVLLGKNNLTEVDLLEKKK